MPPIQKEIEGGNAFFVKPNRAGMELHKVWDYALGKGAKGKEREINNQTTLIISKYSANTGNYDLTSFSPIDWSLESFNHAVQDVHLNGNLQGTIETNKDNGPSFAY